MDWRISFHLLYGNDIMILPYQAGIRIIKILTKRTLYILRAKLVDMLLA